MKIKRPLFITALSILVVIYAINTMPGSIVYASLALFALFTFIHRFTANRYTPHLVLFLVAARAGMAYMKLYDTYLTDKITSIESMGNVVVTGKVMAVSSSSATPFYTVDIDTVNEEKCRNLKVTVYSGDIYNIGDSLEMSGKLKGFTRKSNYQYQYSQGIWAYFYPENVTLFRDKQTFTGFFTQLRTLLTDKARKIFPSDTVPLSVAMGIGDRSLLDDNTVNAFNFTGITHALVVSGLHVSFIAMAVNRLLYFVPVKKKLKNIVTIFVIFLFMGMAGFTPSIMRAGVLLIALTLGRTFIVEVDNYTVLAMLILITLFINPYSAVNVGLLLSYSAYFGVIQAADISREKGYNSIISSLLMNVFAICYTSPVMAMVGMDMTWLSPLFNMVLSLPIMIVCILSFFLPVCSFVPFLGTIIVSALAPVNRVFIRLLLLVSSFAEKNLSFAVIDMSTEKVKVIVFSAVIAVAVAFIQFESINIKRFFIIAVPILSLLCYNYLNRDVITVQIFDGSSNPSYLVSQEDKNCLVVSENINSTRFRQITDNFKIEKYDEIIVCSKKAADIEMYMDYTDNLKVADNVGTYSNDLCRLYFDKDKQTYSYILSVGDVQFGFSHNKADMSDYNLDFYFFGADTPQAVTADNYFYFYPVIKKNIEITQEKQAAELYGMLTVKIKTSTGRYFIVEDVKNYGGRI